MLIIVFDNAIEYQVYLKHLNLLGKKIIKHVVSLISQFSLKNVASF